MTAAGVLYRVRYFWYEHKWGAAAGCLVIALFLYGGFGWLTREPEPILYGELLNQTVEEDVVEAVTKEGLRAMGKDPDTDRILLETGLVIDVEHPESSAMDGTLEMMTSQIFSHELDFLIGPPEVMDYYANLGALVLLDDYLDTKEDVWDGLFVESCNGDGEAGQYGIDIRNTSLGQTTEDTVFCILKNSERKEETIAFLKSLLS